MTFFHSAYNNVTRHVTVHFARLSELLYQPEEAVVYGEEQRCLQTEQLKYEGEDNSPDYMSQSPKSPGSSCLAWRRAA